MSIFVHTEDNNELTGGEAILLNQYNDEIDQADKEIEVGNFISNKEVKQFFEIRRKKVQLPGSRKG